MVKDVSVITSFTPCGWTIETRVFPSDPRLAVNMGAALAEQGLYGAALAYYDAALMRDPDLKEAWNNKGRALNALERPQEALICLDKALEIDSSYHAAWVNRGIALALLGRLEGALKSFDVAIDLDPNDPKAWYNKGVALLKLNRTQQACQCAERALTLDPSYAEAKRLKETACHSTEP